MFKWGPLTACIQARGGEGFHPIN